MIRARVRPCIVGVVWCNLHCLGDFAVELLRVDDGFEDVEFWRCTSDRMRWSRMTAEYSLSVSAILCVAQTHSSPLQVHAENFWPGRNESGASHDVSHGPIPLLLSV